MLPNNSSLNYDRNLIADLTPLYIMGKDVNASELISKFLLGQLSETEKDELKKWANASQENRARFLELTDVDKLMSFAHLYFKANDQDPGI
jgi:ribosome biogenesis protein Tsr3